MVSSSTVSSDASLVTDVFSNYSSGINAINNDSVWSGKSKENAVDQMNKFVSEFNSPISSQMESFSDALEKYEEWEKKKEEYEELSDKINSYNISDSSNFKDDVGELRSKLETLNEELTNLSKEIKTILADVSSKKINATVESIDTSANFSIGDFVNYYQGDYHQSYGYGSTIANAGCGPTSMAMVTTYLTGETHDPVELANWSLKRGYHIPNAGTAWEFFTESAKAYGIDCQQTPINSNNIKSALSSGKPIIMNVGPGTFTKGGHYIVLRGLTSDGKVVVSDPASRDRSQRTYDVSVFCNEGKGMWVFGADKTSEIKI